MAMLKLLGSGAVTATLLLSACEQRTQPYQVETNEGLSLAAPLALPPLQGSREDIIQSVCAWADAAQQPFTPEEIEDVFVETMRGPDGARYIPWDMVAVYLQSAEGAQSMVLRVDPSVRTRPMRGSEAVYTLVDHVGLWSFSKTS